MQTAQTLFIYTETPLHAGTGMGLGSVDLPIQRESLTQYPMIQNGGIKGAIRSQLPRSNKIDADIAFGFERTTNGEVIGTVGGAISFGDVRIMAFPIQSLRGIYAYVTCSAVLNRLRDWLSHQGVVDLPSIPANEPSALCSSDQILIDDAVVLDNTPLKATVSDMAKQWAAWLAKYALLDSPIYAHTRTHLSNYFVIVSDEDFENYVTQGTQEITRIQIKQSTRTTAQGALFTQELVPAESLFYVPIFANKPRASSSDFAKASALTVNMDTSDLLMWLDQVLPQQIQIGADESIGCGFVTLQLLKANKEMA